MSVEAIKCPWCGAGDPRFYDLGTQFSCLSFEMKDGSEARTDACRARESSRAYDMLLGAFPEECGSVSLLSCVAVLLRKLAERGNQLSAIRQQLAEATAERDELQATFGLQWKADMRAIKLWQEAHPERKNIWPDRCNMVTWLMEQMDAADRARERCECGAFDPDPAPCESQPCGCQFIGGQLAPCQRHLTLGRLPVVRYSDGTDHHFDRDGNCYAESGPKTC